jgi:protein gp37
VGAVSRGTSIEWTDDSWNPVRARLKANPAKVGWHCVHKSEGCRNCYAESFNLRLGTQLAYKPGHERDLEIFLDEKMLLAPLRWRKPRKIFVCSMTDLFADFVSDEMLDQIFAVMALCPSHVFQVLTKRPERMRAYLSRPGVEVRIGLEALGLCCESQSANSRSKLGAGVKIKASDINPGGLSRWPLPNVWLGVSVEDQAAADERIPILLDMPAAVRWLSCEPLLGPLDLARLRPPGCTWLNAMTGDMHAGPSVFREFERGIDWIVAGGESGPGARPMHPDWARALRDQCTAAGVPFLFKQWGAWSDAHATAIGPVSRSTGGATNDFGEIAWPDGTVGHGCAEERGGPGLKLTKWHHKRDAGRLLDGVQHDGYPA